MNIFVQNPYIICRVTLRVTLRSLPTKQTSGSMRNQTSNSHTRNKFGINAIKF